MRELRIELGARERCITDKEAKEIKFITQHIAGQNHLSQ